MNKAAFLNIVRQVAPIQDQEVDDLEKLVVSFPYCQTAHVLLAKAAHDRGSMLSTQKLRRAAAHASNRQVLKQLIYAAPATETHFLPQADEPETEGQPMAALDPVFENEAESGFITAEPQAETTFTEDTFETDQLQEEEALAEEETQTDLSLTEETVPTASYPESPELTPLPDFEEPIEDTLVEAHDTATEEATSAEEPASALNGVLGATQEEVPDYPEEAEAPEQDQLDTAATLGLFFENEAESEALEQETEESEAHEEEELEEAFTAEEDDEFNLDELLELIQINGLSSLSAPIPSVNLSHEEIISELTSPSGTTLSGSPAPVPAEDSLAQPLVSSTPVDDGLAAYLEIAELYTVYDTSGYEFPTLKVNNPEPAPGEAADDQDPYLSIFTQNNLAYWMGSSRLGESIQLKDELTSQTPFYFQPELILEHVKSGPAPAPEPPETPAAKLDKQLFIINQFLKSAPKRKNVANAQLPQEPQEDLSAKSSKPKKNLVSENLALILVKQGKARKAIKIYEQLIVKFPEKKSYFAEQIEKLRNEL